MGYADDALDGGAPPQQGSAPAGAPPPAALPYNLPPVGPTTPYAPPPPQPGFWHQVQQKLTPAFDAGAANRAASLAGRRDYTGLPNRAPVVGAPTGHEQPPPNDAPAAAAPAARPYTIPAHEVDVAGPTLRKAWNQSEAVEAAAIDRVAHRDGNAAAGDIAIQDGLRRDALAREDQEKARADVRRAEDEKHMAAFDKDSSESAKFAIDNDRLWKSKGAGQKAAFFLASAFSGLGRGATGGHNSFLDKWKDERDADVAAQKAHYDAMRGRVGDDHTLYSMGMQKYANEDAALEHARAAHTEAGTTMLRQLATRWKGTELANHADEAVAALQNEKAAHVQAGTRYQQAQRVNPVGTLTASQQFELQRDRLKAGYEAQARADERADKRGEKQDNDTQEGAKYLATELENKGVVGQRTDLDRIQKQIGQSGDVAGMGQIVGHLPDWAVSSAGEHNRQALANYAGQYKKDITGAAASENEQKRIDRVTQGTGSADDVRWFVNFEKERLGNREKSIRAGASPQANATFDRRNGVNPDAPAFPSSTPVRR